MATPNASENNPLVEKKSCRLDKWLWAARFFKTRNLAKNAIDRGKVHYNGQRVKTSKLVECGAELRVPCGWDEKTVIVKALSDKRRGAPEANLLYEETSASISNREQRAAERKAGAASFTTEQRPTKKQRRQIHRFKRIANEDRERDS